MSTLVHFNSEIISQTVEAQSSRVPTPLPDDPYVAVRQAYLVNIDTEPGLIEDLRETEVPQPLLVVPSPVPSLDDLHLIVGQAYTPATVDTESEPEEAPSKTDEFEAFEPSNKKAAALSPSAFCKRCRSSYETSSSSPSAIPLRKSYRGTSELVEDTEDESLDSGTEREGSEDKSHGSEDEGPGLKDKGPGLEEEEEAALRRRELAVREGKMTSTFEVGQSSRSVLEHEGAERVSAFKQSTLVTWVDPKDGRVYTNILTYVQPSALVQTMPSPEWSSGSLPVSPSSPTVLTPIASPMTTLAATIAVDENEFLEVRAAIWRPILALEAWAGQTDAQRAALWHAIYDIQRENHDLRKQITKERHEQLELTNRVARIERSQESRGE
nr:hypothetical protein [Tanacetum cinerariifolium]